MTRRTVLTCVCLPALALLSGAAAAQQVLSGYAASVASGRMISYPSFLAREDAQFIWRRLDKTLVWRTEPVPTAADTVFVFVGGNHHPGQCELLVNGQYALTFRTGVREKTTFYGEHARMLFDCRDDLESRGYSGLYYLWVSASLVRPGEPCELEARFLCGKGQAWFAVWERADAVDIAAQNGWLRPHRELLDKVRLAVPATLPHSLGVQVPLAVEWGLPVDGALTAGAAVKSVFSEGFSSSMGTKTMVPEGDRLVGSFTHKNLDPEPMLYVFKVRLEQDGKHCLNLESDVLLGDDREAIFARPDQSDYEPYTLSDQVKTPAFAFLKPGWPDEPLSVHFLTHTNYDREIIELAQRMDLVFSRSGVFLRAVKSHTSRRYAEDIQRSDPGCVVICNMMWNSFSAELQKEILDRVSKGMGLVCIDLLRPNDIFNRAVSLEVLDSAPLTRGIPVSVMAALSASGQPENWAQCSRFGEGRIALLKYHTSNRRRRGRPGAYGGPMKPESMYVWVEDQPVPAGLDAFRPDRIRGFLSRNAPPDDPFDVMREYYNALLIRAICWASSREARVRVEDVAVTDGIARISLNETRQELSLSIRVIDRFGAVAFAESGVPAGAETDVALTRLNSGLHFLDVQLWEGGRVHDFFSTSFLNAIAPVAITHFAPAASCFVGTQPPRFRADFENRSGAARSLPFDLLVDDIWGRTLVRERITLTVVPGMSSHTLTAARPDTSACFVFLATLRQPESGLQAQCHLTYPDEGREQQEFEFDFWGASRLNHLPWYRLARENGFSAMTNGHTFPGALRNLRKFEEHVIPMKIRAQADLPANVRPGCLDAPDSRAATDRLVAFKTQLLRPYGPKAYSLGHEASLCVQESSTSVENYCFCEHSLRKFREWLQRKHGDVGALNRVWGAQFADFDHVVPKTYEELTDRQNIAAWMEHRQFMDVAFNEALCRCAATIRETDPTAPVGCTGLPGGAIGSFLGFEPYLMCTTLDYFALYGSKKVSLKLFLSHRQPRGKLVVFTGYDYASPNKTYNLTEAWRYLFRGCTGISYYLLSGVHDDCEEPGYFHPDFTLSSQGKWFSETVREINGGPGMLLFGQRHVNNGVGIYFSQNAVHAVTGADPSRRLFMEFSGHLSSWQLNLECYGLSPDFVSDRQVRSDPEALSGYKVMILPACASLSSVEMSVIERFVEGGGTVFVDPLFGLYDESGRFMPDQLCPWFEPCPDAFAGQLQNVSTYNCDGEMDYAGRPSLIQVKALALPVRRLRGGRPVAGVRFQKPEVFLERMAVGKGTVYNGSFMQIRNQALALGLRELLTAHDIDLRLTVAAPDGRPVPEVLVADVSGRNKRFFGVLYSSSGARFTRTDAVLRFRDKAHVYDVRQHKHLGETDQLQVTLDPSQPLLYCTTSTPIAAHTLAVRTPRVRRGDTLSVEIRNPERGGSPLLYKVWCELPAGEYAREPFTRKVWAEPAAPVDFQVAHNDPVGTWRVHAREVISGQAVIVEVVVE